MAHFRSARTASTRYRTFADNSLGVRATAAAAVLFAQQYADRTVDDHARLVAAINSGG